MLNPISNMSKQGADILSPPPPNPRGCWGVVEFSHQLFGTQGTPDPILPTHGIHHFLLEHSPSPFLSTKWGTDPGVLAVSFRAFQTPQEHSPGVLSRSQRN